MTLTARLLVSSIALLTAASISAPARADMPDIQLTATSAITVPGFPATVAIPLTIEHQDLHNLNVFEVLVDNVSLTGSIGNPFDGADACAAAMNSNGLTCSTSSSWHADVTAPWTVSAPGSYLLKARIRHQGLQDIDDETVTVQLIVVEYPAPPAIANAYVKAQRYKLTSGTRGCILSTIAHEHGQNERYGPKGGPYDESLVHSDVETLKATSCYGL